MVQRYYPVALASVTLKVAGSNPAQNAKYPITTPATKPRPPNPDDTGLRTRNHLTPVFGPNTLDAGLRTNPLDTGLRTNPLNTGLWTNPHDTGPRTNQWTISTLTTHCHMHPRSRALPGLSTPITNYLHWSI